MSLKARWATLLVLALAVLAWLTASDIGRRPRTASASAAGGPARPRRSASLTGLEELRAALPAETSVAPEDKPGLTGQVVDSLTGQPVADAEIVLSAGQETLAEGTSGADGHFALDLPEADDEEQADGEEAQQPLELAVTAKGYADAELRLGPREALSCRPHHLVRIDPGARVTGRMIEPDGTPVAHAVVNAFDDKQRISGYAGTDDEGRFEISELAAGTHVLSARHSSTEALTYRRIELRTGERVEVELVVLVVREVPLFELRFQVLDAAGLPFPELAVTARPSGAPNDLDHALLAPRNIARTDEEGRSAFDVGASGWYEIELRAYDKDHTNDDGPPLLSAWLFAGEQSREETITVPTAKALHCSLLDPEGQPVAIRMQGVVSCPVRDDAGPCGPGSRWDVSEPLPTVVHRSWPFGAPSAEIELSGERDGRAVKGTLRLHSPDEPCVVRGAYRE